MKNNGDWGIGPFPIPMFSDNNIKKIKLKNLNQKIVLFILIIFNIFNKCFYLKINI